MILSLLWPLFALQLQTHNYRGASFSKLPDGGCTFEMTQNGKHVAVAYTAKLPNLFMLWVGDTSWASVQAGVGYPVTVKAKDQLVSNSAFGALGNMAIHYLKVDVPAEQMMQSTKKQWGFQFVVNGNQVADVGVPDTSYLGALKLCAAQNIDPFAK